jgi:hypothetical protein
MISEAVIAPPDLRHVQQPYMIVLVVVLVLVLDFTIRGRGPLR